MDGDRSLLIRQQNAEFLADFSTGDVPGTVILSHRVKRFYGHAIIDVAQIFDLFKTSKPEHARHERQAGSFEFAAVKFIWFIDYYDKANDQEADPEIITDLTRCTRLMTIMLPDEYAKWPK